MTGIPEGRFWGKLRRDHDGRLVAWHPLEHHCLDVAAVTEALLTRTTLGLHFARLVGRKGLSDRLVARLCVLAGMHDLGKAAHRFQRRADPAVAGGGHVGPLLCFLSGETASELFGRFVESSRLRQIATWLEPSDDLPSMDECVIAWLSAVGGHHGGLPPQPGGCAHVDWAPTRERDPFAGVERVMAALAEGWPEAWESGTDADRLPGRHRFIHGFAGLVMLADWLASDDRVFQYSRDPDASRVGFARRAAASVVVEAGLSGEAARSGVPEGAHWDDVFAFDPRPAQAELAKRPFREGGGSVVLVEAETGSGKTEAAFHRYLRLFERGEVDGLYFAVPTRSAATQLHGRLVRLVERAFGALPPAARPPVILAVPGYLRVDDVEGQRLPGFEVLWPDERDGSGRWLSRQRTWAAEHPKRYLAGAVVVGTIDQVLLSALRTRHAHMRTAALLRQLLVVDEVHASDRFMVRVLEEVLRRHVAAAGHVMLLSATLGSDARQRLFKACGVGGGAGEWPYPAVVEALPGTTAVAVPCAPVQRRCVGVALATWSDEDIAGRAIQAADSGARVLVIRNTVRDAVATWREVVVRDRRRCFAVRGVPTLHHGRFAPEDRKLLDRAVEDALKPGARRGAGCVVVATRTVEQSLDVDADWLVTDICPADVLLQRLGRLHRHLGTTRPPGHPLFAEPHATVVLPPEGVAFPAPEPGKRSRLGLGTVFEDVLAVRATAEALVGRDSIRIPEDSRSLVEAATSPQRLREFAEQLGGAWFQHWMQVDGRVRAEAGQAGILTWSWDTSIENVRLGSGEDGKVQTRLGLDDRRVSFARPWMGPFGAPVAELTIPGWMLRDRVGDDAVFIDVEASTDQEGTILFSIAGLDFRYDAAGLQQERLA